MQIRVHQPPIRSAREQVAQGRRGLLGQPPRDLRHPCPHEVEPGRRARRQQVELRTGRPVQAPAALTRAAILMASRAFQFGHCAAVIR